MERIIQALGIVTFLLICIIIILIIRWYILTAIKRWKNRINEKFLKDLVIREQGNRYWLGQHREMFQEFYEFLLKKEFTTSGDSLREEADRIIEKYNLRKKD